MYNHYYSHCRFLLIPTKLILERAFKKAKNNDLAKEIEKQMQQTKLKKKQTVTKTQHFCLLHVVQFCWHSFCMIISFFLFKKISSRCIPNHCFFFVFFIPFFESLCFSCLFIAYKEQHGLHELTCIAGDIAAGKMVYGVRLTIYRTCTWFI